MASASTPIHQPVDPPRELSDDELHALADEAEADAEAGPDGWVDGETFFRELLAKSRRRLEAPVR